MASFNQMLPAIAQTVELLHPGDDKEALKINAGTALLSALISSLQQASQPVAVPVAPQVT